MLRGMVTSWRRLGWPARVDRALWGAVALAALAAIAAFGYAATLRVPYPFELEWMEGAIVDHVRIVLAGEPLYRRPSLDFTPYIYTPLYYYACALVAAVTGPSFAAARLVSTLAIFASLFIIHGFVKRETDDPTAALLSAGSFAATYQLSAYWFDLARPDSLALALLLGGCYLARFGRARTHAVTAGFLLALAVLAKQTVLTPALAAVGYVLLVSWRRGLWCAASGGGLLAAATALLQARSNGWFVYYVLTVPGQHRWMWHLWRDVLQGYLWHRTGIALLWALLAVAVVLPRRRDWQRWALYVALLGLSIASGEVGALHKDGFVNAFLPAYGVLAIVAGLGVAWFRQGTADAPRRRRLRLFGALTLLGHFGLLAYDPNDALPRRRDEAAGREVLAALRAAPRPMLMLGHGFYGYRAGHPGIHAHSMALADVFKTRDERTKRALQREIIDAIRSKRFGSVVMGKGVTDLLPGPILGAIHRHYRLDQRLFGRHEQRHLLPRSGFPARPEEIWIVRRAE